MATTATTPPKGTGSQNQIAKRRSKTGATSSILPTTRTNYRPSRQTCHASAQYTHETSLYISVPYLLLSSGFFINLSS